MNVEGVTLKLLLHEPNKDKALEIFSRLRPEVFSAVQGSILRHIKEFYDDRGYVPSINELITYRSRDKKTVLALNSLKLIDSTDIDIDLAVSVLEDQHAQNVSLDLINDFLKKVSLMDKYELQDKLAAIPLKLDEAMKSTNGVFTIRDIEIFSVPDEIKKAQIQSGISDEWDREAGGYYRQELVLLGGKRGSGKSIICANLVANQHKQGNVSIYFTIEMTAKETYQRIMSILSGVPFSRIKKGECTLEDNYKLAKTMASLFEGGEEVFEKYFNEKPAPDIYSFQDELYSTCVEKEDGKIIIIDDRALSISTVDTKLAMYKGMYEDKLALIVVDYLNQMTIDGNEADMYDWKPQIVISKSLKNLSRKHDVCIVSPYQIDEDGRARFSKGILDAPDVAQLVHVENKENKEQQSTLVFETTKARGTDDTGKHRVAIDWPVLTIDPRPVIIQESVEEDSPPTKSFKKPNKDEAVSELM